MRGRISALLAAVLLVSSPAAGFDTFWHVAAIRKVGEEFGFTGYARNIMQLGNFSPDFFGPVAEYAAAHLNGKEQAALREYGIQNAQVRAVAIFLHFDNLGGELDRNSKFDRIFNRLLETTQNLLSDYNTRRDLDEPTRKVLILVTLGASLHAAQDFYSHSDWIHNDFNKTALPMVRLPSGDSRAPTWFEFRDKFGDPDKWPFQVKAGIYPPIAGALNTHTHMNHDNSRLIYKEYENPGQPLRPQAEYHNSGPFPARGQDPASVLQHQQLAVNTATAASIEWIKRIQGNANAKAAIDFAKGWDLKKDSPKLAKELEAGLAIQMALSCAAGKWDGDDPPSERAVLCKSVLERRANPFAGATGPQLENEIIGLIAGLGVPWALKFTGKFWDIHSRYHILERLADGIGSGSGHYSFPQK